MSAFLITVTVLSLLAVCSMGANMYIYSYGIFRTRRARRPRTIAVEQQPPHEEEFYVGATDRSMQWYPYRVLLFFIVGILLLCIIDGFLLSSIMSW
jgi:hypothetical protein